MVRTYTILSSNEQRFSQEKREKYDEPWIYCNCLAPKDKNVCTIICTDCPKQKEKKQLQTTKQLKLF